MLAWEKNAILFRRGGQPAHEEMIRRWVGMNDVECKVFRLPMNSEITAIPCCQEPLNVTSHRGNAVSHHRAGQRIVRTQAPRRRLCNGEWRSAALCLMGRSRLHARS